MSEQIQSEAPSGVPSAAIPKVNGVFVIETVKQGIKPQQIMAVIPQEIRATTKLYLEGKIREWYSRGDGKGIVFLLVAAVVIRRCCDRVMTALPHRRQVLRPVYEVLNFRSI